MMKSGQKSHKANSMTGGRLSGWRQMAAGKISRSAVSLLALLFLVSCGSGGDTVASGGIGGTGVISIGPISALGSIFVNGVKFDIAGAAIDLNGSRAEEGMLQVGMVVTVEGTLNEDGTTGIADSVVYDDNVQGPIDAIDSVLGSLMVLGQKIFINNETVLVTGAVDPELTDFGYGDIIEVSGLPTADGSIRATRISRRSAGDDVQISGLVSDVGGYTFRINDQVVDYSMIPQSPGWTDPQNGQFVDVRGNLDSNGVLIATELMMKASSPTGGRQMQLAGYIRTVAADTFTIGVPMGLLTVKVGQETVIVGGTSADLEPGGRVAVQGSMSMGTITAQKIEILP